MGCVSGEVREELNSLKVSGRLSEVKTKHYPNQVRCAIGFSLSVSDLWALGHLTLNIGVSNSYL